MGGVLSQASRTDRRSAELPICIVQVHCRDPDIRVSSPVDKMGIGILDDGGGPIPLKVGQDVSFGECRHQLLTKLLIFQGLPPFLNARLSTTRMAYFTAHHLRQPFPSTSPSSPPPLLRSLPAWPPVPVHKCRQAELLAGRRLKHAHRTILAGNRLHQAHHPSLDHQQAQAVVEGIPASLGLRPKGRPAQVGRAVGRQMRRVRERGWAFNQT